MGVGSKLCFLVLLIFLQTKESVLHVMELISFLLHFLSFLLFAVLYLDFIHYLSFFEIDFIHYLVDIYILCQNIICFLQVYLFYGATITWQVSCSLCSETMDRDILDVHKGENCPKRIVTCEYCEFPLPAIDLLEHQVVIC